MSTAAPGTPRHNARYRAEIDRILARHNHHAHGRTGNKVRRASQATRIERERIVKLAHRVLAQLGHRLNSPADLGERHVRALMTHWEGQRLSLQTLHARLSTLRVFMGWIGKAGALGSIADYVAGEHRRRIAATRNLAWQPNGVDPADIIRKARALDERMGLYLSLQDAFGLRMKEAVEMRPLRAISADGAHLEVSDGTKGGRPRLIGIDSDKRRDAVAWARRVAMASRTKAIRWPECTWRQARNRYYWYCRRLGITRDALGITSHGLRHGVSQEGYRAIAGVPTPIEGGAPGRIDRDTHRYASLKVSQMLGHGRVDVTGFYYGSYGHGLRATVADAMKGGVKC